MTRRYSATGESLQVDSSDVSDRCSGNWGSRHQHVATQASRPSQAPSHYAHFTCMQLVRRTGLTLPPQCPEAPADAVKCAGKMQGSVLTTRRSIGFFSLVRSLAFSTSLVFYPPGSKLGVMQIWTTESKSSNNAVSLAIRSFLENVAGDSIERGARPLHLLLCTLTCSIVTSS